MNLFTFAGGTMARGIVVGTAGFTGASVRIVLELPRRHKSKSRDMCTTTGRTRQ